MEVLSQNVCFYRIVVDDEESLEALDEILATFSERRCLTFEIRSFQPNVIDEVINEIDTRCSKEHGVKNFEDESIRQLNLAQEEELKALQQLCQMNVVVNRRKGIVTFEGLVDDIKAAETKLQGFLVDVLKQGKPKVQWYFMEDARTKTPYPLQLNRLIENAYEQYEADQSNNSVTFQKENSSQRYKIDFNKNLEITNGQKSKKVIRRQFEFLPIPDTWIESPTDEDYISVPLDETSDEYYRLESKFKDTISNVKVVGIERIQNSLLYTRYMVKRQFVMRKHGVENAERSLWHGTSPDAIKGINQNGFNRSFCGRNGTSYGDGTYFAQRSDYSDGYAETDGNGLQHMYRARVITGRYDQGCPGMIVPPKPEDDNCPYHSVVDNVNDPSMFVIFYDDQAYPEYLITYREKCSEDSDSDKEDETEVE